MKKIFLIAILAIVAQMSFAQGLPSYVPTNGLVGYWGFNGNANDESGNGNNGTVNGSVQLTTDRFGNSNSSYLFPGNSSSYISVPGSQQLQIQSEITISAWILMDGGEYNARIIQYSDNINSGYAIYAHGNSNISRPLTGLITNVGGLGVGLSSELNSLVWNHVCFVANSNGSGKLYLNGILVSTVNGTALNNVNYMGELNIGRIWHSRDAGWGGKLDDIGIWNRALTQQEITQLYTATPAPTEVAIGTQTWTTKNLDVATYSDGTIIPQVTDQSEWANLTTGAWCYYNNDPANGATYGKLYNWYAVAGVHDNDPNTPNKKLAPSGWHVPSDVEWNTLFNFLGSKSVAGNKIKESGTSHWTNPNTGADNSTGFSALPGGARYNDGGFSAPTIPLGGNGFYWSSTEYNITMSYDLMLSYFNGYASLAPHSKGSGESVRCIKNTTPKPTASAQTFCGETTVTNLVATGTDLKWYAEETGGTALATDIALSTGTYYVSQTLNTIESDRTAVAVTINEAQITASANTISIGSAVTLTASASSSTGSSTLPANLQNGLVGYWPFNGNANDESGNGNNATVIDCVSINDRNGNPNSAYQFGGSRNVSVPMTLQIYDLAQRTFACWFKANGAQNGGRLYETTFKNGGIAFQYNNGNVFDTWYAYSQHCCNIVGMNGGELNQWHYLVSTADDSTGLTKVYLDGVLIASSDGYPAGGGCNINSNWNWQGEFIRFGLGASGESFNGDIDDISIYNRALSPDEIALLYSPASSYTWSTGENTASITPSPTETTTYWCDVTVNGVTCRKEMTIIVKLAVISPINYCHKSTAVPLTATPTTGSTLKWYATATSKTALATAPTPTTTTVGSKTYYVAERTAAGVESERLPIVVNINPLPTPPTAIQVTDGSNSITKVGPFIGTTTPLTLSTSATNATSFDWILPKGVVVTSAVNSNTTDADGVTTANASGNITINFSGVPTGLETLYIKVKSVGNCGVSNEKKIGLTRALPSTPGTISTTNSNVCFGIVGTPNKVTYSIAPVAGAFAQGYIWTVPTGATIVTPFANASTMTYGTEIEVSYDSSFVSGFVTVKASNGVGVSRVKVLSVMRRVPSSIASITAPLTFCVNETATITVPSIPGVTYLWSATNNTNLTAEGNSVTASFENTSSLSAYTSLTVSQYNGCGYGTSKKVTLRRGSCTTSKINSQNRMQNKQFNAFVYPNPSSTAFEVTTNTEEAFDVRVYDLLGRLIEEQNGKGNNLKIGANYQSGTYILKISQGENQKTLQVIKK